MQALDWAVIALYLVAALGVGLYLARRGARSLVEFFVSGRSLPWWLAGTSMAATTFSVDTPLYIAGVVGTRGIAGNWEWWSFGIAHLILVYAFARLWRRSAVVTDPELTEIRYSGRSAQILRATKAFLFAVPINCIGIGYVMLAMVKVVGALELWQSLGFEPGESTKLWSVVGVTAFVLLYASLAGLWGVVAADFFQFFLALFGAIAVAVAAVRQVGGIRELVPAAQQATEHDVLSLLPLQWGQGLLELQWNDAAGISLSTFGAYVFVQWWAFRRSDGGGVFVQRLAASRDEAAAEKAAWFFNLLHYVIRTWPWVLVALAAVVLYPDLEDPELGYPRLMLDFLPPGLLGLVVASLVAAFMSTVSTSINWGASYLTNDLYRRFLDPQAPQARLILVGRLASVLIAVLGALAAFWAENVATIFRLAIALGTGAGLVLILRWFWWRINAAAELAALVGSFAVGAIVRVLARQDPQAVLPWAAPTVELLQDFGIQLIVISALTAAIWIPAMLLTAPESAATLDAFYQRVRPSGWGWRYQRARTGTPPGQDLGRDVRRVLAATLLLFGTMLAVGGFLLLQSLSGWIWLVVAVAGGVWLRQLNKPRIPPMPRPGLDDRDWDE